MKRRPAWLLRKMNQSKKGAKKPKKSKPVLKCQLIGLRDVLLSRGQDRIRPKGDLLAILKTLDIDLMSKKETRVDLNMYATVMQQCQEKKLDVVPIPHTAMKIANPNLLAKFSFQHTMDWTKVPTTITDALFPFQKQGVERMVCEFNGRVLLADDMGLGKTLQAITVMSYYQSWPLLIICPSYLRHNWKKEILQWTEITEADIVLVKNGKVNPKGKVTIISYGLVHRMADVLAHYRFQSVIVDESHFIKNPKAQRTKACVPLIRKAKRALLLSGTPASNRPVELYSQVSALRPCYFGSYSQFTRRYCDAHHGLYGYDVTGASNQKELTFLLTQTLMVRRLKQHVLTQLPSKTRSQIVVDLKASELKAMQPGMRRWKELNRLIFSAPPGSEQSRTLIFERKALISDLFHKNAEAKKVVAGKVLLNTLDNVQKLVVFCVHQVMMDHVQDLLVQKHVSFMRIDGKVTGDARHANVTRFQNTPCRVALLSIGAASTGITLTAASSMLFTETSWSPSDLTQAEDRIHRIGQTSAVDIRYLIARGTIDENIFKTLNSKLDVTSTLLNGQEHGGESFVGEEITFERESESEDEDPVSEHVPEHVPDVDFTTMSLDAFAAL